MIISEIKKCFSFVAPSCIFKCIPLCVFLLYVQAWENMWKCVVVELSQPQLLALYFFSNKGRVNEAEQPDRSCCVKNKCDANHRDFSRQRLYSNNLTPTKQGHIRWQATTRSIHFTNTATSNPFKSVFFSVKFKNDCTLIEHSLVKYWDTYFSWVTSRLQPVDVLAK